MIRVDVLAQQRDLHYAFGHHCLRLAQDIGGSARIFSPAGVGNNTECAKFITPFLYGYECRNSAAPCLIAAPMAKRIELRGGGKFSFNDLLTRRGARQHVG